MTLASHNHSAPDGPELALVAEWLAQQFLQPMDADRVHAARSAQGQMALHRIGDLLDQSAAADVLCLALSTGSINEVVATLQRSHTMFFGGVQRQHSVLPYASAWDGTGHLFGPAIDRMQVILNRLDVHVPETCPEPADHIAIQLAGMAEALRRENPQGVLDVLNEMHDWAGRFANELYKNDTTGFYGNVALLLTGLLDKIQTHQTCAMGQDTAACVALA